MSPAAASEIDRVQGVLEPTGYRLLLRIPNLEAQMKQWANLVMPDETRALEEFAQLTGQVVAMGPDAYEDKAKFPSGRWCEVGDYVIIRAYAGTRLVLRAKDGTKTTYCLINDDTVQGVVRGDPTQIERPV